MGMTTRFKNIALSLLALFLILGVNNVQPSQALGSLALEPLHLPDEPVRHVFKYVIQEGEEVEDSVQIINNSDNEVTALVFSSGYVVEEGEIIETEPADAVAAMDPGYWVEFSEPEIVLPAHTRKIVPFKVSVPESADVGEHVGAILTTEKKVAEKGSTGGSGMSIVFNIGSKLTVTVPGDVHRELLINNITHKIDREKDRLFNFVFNLTNKGNVTLKPTIDIEMKGIFGQVGSMSGEPLASILRSETKDAYKTWVKRAPYFGRFVADFNIHLGEYTQTNKDGTTTILPDEVIPVRYVFWIFPWLELLYLLVFLLIMYVIRSIWLYIIVVKRLKTKTEIYTVKKGDTLTQVARKLGIDAKMLAKFNMLAWPYELTPGDHLLIPVGVLSSQEWRAKEKEIIRDGEIMGGIFGHFLFPRKSMHKVAGKLDKASKPAETKIDLKNTQTVVVEEGDTIEDVAKFAKTTVKKLVEMNRLEQPYTLEDGQELIIPIKAKLKKRKTTGKKAKPSSSKSTKSKPKKKKPKK